MKPVDCFICVLAAKTALCNFGVQSPPDSSLIFRILKNDNFTIRNHYEKIIIQQLSLRFDNLVVRFNEPIAL